jgi:hypothetical protein
MAKKKAVKKAKGVIGRPPKPLDWKQVEALCKIQCTEEEICSVVDLSTDALNKRCRKEQGVTFKQFFHKKRSGGKASLRRNQWRMSENIPTMAIWLGKQYLAQSDKNEQTNTNKNIEIKVQGQDEQL